MIVTYWDLVLAYRKKRSTIWKAIEKNINEFFFMETMSMVTQRWFIKGNGNFISETKRHVP